MDSISNDVNTFADDVRSVCSGICQMRPEDVDTSIMAMLTVEQDTRFYKKTLQALLQQRVLPGKIVIVDCAQRVHDVVQTTMSVQLSSTSMKGLLTRKSSSVSLQTVTVDIVIAPVKQARSFGDAIKQALQQLAPLPSVKALWLLHDDSRPANEYCLQTLRDTWHNTPTASILGAKQVDWEVKTLHNVGKYAWRHGLRSLSVDGEPDQEQYDGRSDVFAVSLAGALVPVNTWQTLHGTEPWMTTFAEAGDLCRRICRSGGRVMIVPRAKIAHRRARFESIRTKHGTARNSGSTSHAGLISALRASNRYRYTDMHPNLWLFAWIVGVPASIFVAMRLLVRKQLSMALMRLVMPWMMVGQLPYALMVRSRLMRVTRVTKTRLSALYADRHQIARWKDRCRAFLAQRHFVLLSPLARRHLHLRILRRWSAALLAALLMFIVVLYAYGTPWRAVFSGSSWFATQWLPTGANFAQVFHAAIGTVIPSDGSGMALPPSPWTMIWMLASLVVGGNPALALTLMFFLSAPCMLLSFWALAGVFTRSDTVRVCAGVSWTMLAISFGVFARGDLPMLMVMVFLPAVFAFMFHGVGMYVTEDPIRPVASIQCIAFSGLSLIPVLASQPQLFFAFIIIVLVAIFFVRSHRAMLLLIPVPSILVCLPTIINSITYAPSGMWRQMFASAALPLQSVQGAPGSQQYLTVLSRAFNLSDSPHLLWLSGISLRGVVLLVFALLAVLMAVVSLLLPFALRVSRFMWVVILTGVALSLVATRIAIDTDINGPVASSILPAVALTCLGILSCICMVAGQAVRRFEPLRRPIHDEQDVPIEYQSRTARRQAMREAAARVMRRVMSIVRVFLASAMMVIAVLMGCLAIVSGPASSIAASERGLPMVVQEYLQSNPHHRVLALQANNDRDIAFSVMRTTRGDLLDRNPAGRVHQLISTPSSRDRKLARSSARLLAHADSSAIETLQQMGIGGIYVVQSTDTSSANSKIAQAAGERLNAHINASEGTQLVVTAADHAYYRIDAAHNQQAATATSSLACAQMISLAWRVPWAIVTGIVVLLYCLVALPRLRNHHMIERADETAQEDMNDLA